MKDATLSAIERAREYGIDISLLESSLDLSYEQRLMRLQQWSVFYDELKKAHRILYPQLEENDQLRKVAENTDK